MKVQRKHRIMGLVTALIVLCLPAVAPALDSYSAGYDVVGAGNTGHIAFTFDGSWKVSFDSAQITAATGGSSDPIIGMWQSISSPAQSSYNYLMVSQTTPGSNIWNLAGVANQVVVTSTSGQVLLSGLATAQTIDLNTGTIYWGPVTDIQVNNTIGSSTLQQFAGYATGIMTMTYKTASQLTNWIGNPDVTPGTKTAHYTISLSGDLTSAPEPATWVLMLIGMALLGYSAWQHSRGQETVFSSIFLRM
ncbi:MAG: PEP-CTERM sorting domain-containing protein [Syntrophales bacterium]|nr:PEP-CTERM sorting domain-containing protein [Syntrophales bacterium]